MIRALSTVLASTALAALLAQPAAAQTAAEKLYAELAKLPNDQRAAKILEGAKKEGKVEVLSANYGDAWRANDALWAQRYPDVKYNKNGLLPASLEDRARVDQWSYWGMLELERHLLIILVDMFMTPPDKRNPAAVAEAQKALPKPLGVLNSHLQGRDYLVGSGFTLADLDVASVCSWAKLVKYDLEPTPNVKAWLDRCLSRPAYKAARGGK